MPVNHRPQDAAGAAVRSLLRKLGDSYHESTQRELPSLATAEGKSAHLEAAMRHFIGKCCYCREPFCSGDKARQREHLIPINQTHGGLHCWRNLVYACAGCNAERATLGLHWREFAKRKNRRARRFIERWIYMHPPDDRRYRSVGRRYAKKLYRKVSAVTTEAIKRSLERL